MSDDGRVKSVARVVQRNGHSHTVRERVLKMALSEGYHVVVLRRDGDVKSQRRVHRLVAETFLSDSWFPGALVLHGDDIRTNNHVSNLRWGTQSENMEDRYRNESCPHCGMRLREAS